MNRPHIGIDCRMIHNSGIGTCIKGILPHLIAGRPDWSFTLYGRPAELAAFAWSSLPNAVVHPFQAPIYSPREQLAWATLRGKRPDLLWVPHLNIPYVWPTKLLVTIHDVMFVALPQQFGRVHQLYGKIFYGRVGARADAISFDTHFTAREFTRLIGPPRRRAEVIYNGVDETWFNAASLPRPAAAGAAPYIVTVGNLKPNKNIRRLIEAFFLMQDRIPHSLVIVGKRDGFVAGDNAVETAAASHPRIIFTGFISDADLRATVAHADALIHPSLYEGFGLTPLEAMAAGCPAIISNAGSLPETAGDAAAYFSPTDVPNMAETIFSILKDRPRRLEMRQEGLEHVKAFQWQITSDCLGSMIHEMLAG